ncbi:MAG: HAMP domain-containing sensor histidine kinase [Acidimicrobiia bacterium]|nr:HAMP domain-containing sensor histidine kinase [Acidimicrobiia bacterium]
MLARLEVAFVSRRRFAADVSHELRTPLSIIRGEAELTLTDGTSSARERRLARAVQDAALRSEALIESLLAPARADSTMRERRHRGSRSRSPATVVGERVSDLASAAGVEIDLGLGSGTVEGDRWLLERLIANLVDNGIHHNRTPGWLQVAVGAHSGSTELRVSNSGDVLSDEQATAIFEPFRRLEDDDGPDGFGLGMQRIVQSVAEAHDGTVRAEPRDGGGLDVVVSSTLSGRRGLARPARWAGAASGSARRRPPWRSSREPRDTKWSR